MKTSNMKKEEKSMEEYIVDAKELFDLMSEIGDLISSQEEILYLLGGLNAGYISIVTNITHKKNMPSIDEVFSRLITHERQLVRMSPIDLQLILAS